MLMQIILEVLWSSWFPYGLGLVAVGLLPIKRRWAYRGTFASLGLLWGWLALVGGEFHPPWGVLAAIEALLLLTFGAARGWFQPRLRHGFWAVAGTSFIVYALLVFPLLNRYLEGFDGYSSFGIPIPLIVLTAGVLFFTLDPKAPLVFAVPFVWALAGGPESSRNLVELTGLRMALLASASFLLLLLSDLRKESDRRPVPGLAYRIAYQRRAFFGYGLWALGVATLMLFFLPLPEDFQQVTINAILLSLLGIAFWLAFPAWQSLWYRAAAWWMARVCGRLWLGLRYAWRWGALLLATVALWVALPNGRPQPSDTGQQTQNANSNPKAGQSRDVVNPKAPTDPKKGDGQPKQPAGKPRPGEKNSSWREAERLWARAEAANWPSRLLALILFLWLVYQAYQGRKRLVIGTFSGCGDAELDKQALPGLGARLQSELARISDVYKVIDEATPSSRRPVVEVTPGVLDVGEILKDASAITFGPFKLQANFFAGLLGRFVSGPRLTGALHKIDDQLALTAELSGGGLSYNWRVGSSGLSAEEGRLPLETTLQKLVEELAFRVATDLVSIGSPRWRAVRSYTDGLRLYREAQRQQQGRNSALREAERSFIRALSDDQRFAQCHYNLGVVYRQLGEDGSAQSAFRRALKEGPDNFEASYALAEALVSDKSKKYRAGLWFCEAAIDIDPDDARAWSLAAFAHRYHQQDLAGLKVTLPPQHSAWLEVLELSEIAVALSWRTLCRRTLAGRPSAALEKEKATVFLCTRNLAVVLARSARIPASRQVFRQAAWLAPHDPDLRLYEGRTLFWNGETDDAARVLEGVFADGMDIESQGLLWSVLAQTQARTRPSPEHHEGLRITHSRFLDLAAGASAKELDRMIELSLEAPPDLPKEKRSNGHLP